MIQIKKAVKYDAKLRMSIAGPSGSGKTYTALTLAHALADGKPVCVIDTERGSASKYADDFPEYDVIELDTFSPLLYVEAIKTVQEAGYGVLVIDSLSHAWNGTGGLLEIVESIAIRKYNKNSYAAWKDATPMQNALIDAITRADMHIIVTMRSKQEYALEKNEKTGKSEPKKLGMAPIQRDGLEYEFDVAVDMDIDNTMIVQKSRCSKLAGQVIPKPDARVAEVLKDWLHGAPIPPRENTPKSSQGNHQPAKSNQSGNDTQPPKNRIVDALAPSDIDTLKSEWIDAYGVAESEIEAQWARYLQRQLQIAQPDLQPYHLPVLRRNIAKRKAAQVQAKASVPSVTQVPSVAPEVQQSA